VKRKVETSPALKTVDLRPHRISRASPAKGKIFESRQGRDKLEMLVNEGNAVRPCVARAPQRYLAASHLDHPGVGPQHTSENTQKRRFSSAIRPKNSVHLTGTK
jgi:hypothetical protein